ncbi:monocarboxylate transporter 3-like [Gigantopelta aegis]|uniref:monocarboxylate transporter 3-like n=1 Tax=Gigantopelta aegis TaxID=1735272 RepID=UPI001B887D4E|nr:monocarboxylate transporter 3-like [Gigantopelta aegis]
MSDTAEDEVSKSNGPKEVDEGGRKTEISLLNIPCLEKEDDVLPGNETTALGAATRTSSPSKKVKKTSYLLLTVLCGILLGISLGFLMGLSVFFVEMIDTFQESRAQTSLIQSVCLTVLFGFGALGSVLLSRFGVMRTGLFGGVLATVGCVAASYAQSVLVLVVCIGALTGLGPGLLYLVTFSVMGETVEDRKLRRLLLTLMMFGGGIGGIIYPYFGSVLIAEFGWRRAFLLLGGILLHGCPITMALCSLKSRIELVGGKTDNKSQQWWKTLKFVFI